MSLAVFPPQRTQLITHSPAVQEVYENPGQLIMGQVLEHEFIYYGANTEVMDTSEVLLFLKGCNTSGTRPQERLYHTWI